MALHSDFVRWAAALAFGAALASAQAALAQDSAPLTVADQRPADELKTSWLSLMITSCEYGIRRVAEAEGEPPRLEGLKADLSAALGATLAGKTVTVTHYGVYFNTGALNRKRTYTVNTGLIPSLMETMGSKCSREDTKAGWYQASEVSTPHSPIIVELSAQLDGKTYETRSVYSPETELNPFFSKDKSAPAALAAALKKANTTLIDQILIALSPPPALIIPPTIAEPVTPPVVIEQTPVPAPQ